LKQVLGQSGLVGWPILGVGSLILPGMSHPVYDGMSQATGKLQPLIDLVRTRPPRIAGWCGEPSRRNCWPKPAIRSAIREGGGR